MHDAGGGLFMTSVTQQDAVTSPSAVEVEPVSFVSPMYQCYIEDTDSYGVMYNANYLRSFDRALHSFYAMGDDVMLAYKNDKNNNKEPKRQSMLDTHEDWAIVQVDNQKFKSSPKLGGEYCVHGTLVKHQDDLEIWDLVMHETADPQSTTFNSARITIARPGVFGTPSKILEDSADSSASSSTTTKDTFRLFRDEFDAHSSTHIPLRNVLTLFERSRSNFLGGPDALRTLKEEHGLLFVVTKVNHCCKFPIDNAVRPGEVVLVQTTFQVKRKGMIIDCQQTLKNASGQRVAQATVSLMTIDAETFKPSTNLPDWLRELLGEPTSSLKQASVATGSSSNTSQQESIEDLVAPISNVLDDVTGGWALSYANLEPEDESTPIGIAFLATNIAYGLCGSLLVSQGNTVLGILTEFACFASFVYHFTQLKYGQEGSRIVRLALLTDYFFALSTILVGSIQLYMSHQLPTEVLGGGALAVTSLGACWVWEEGIAYIVLHGLWHFFSAYTGYVIGSTY